MKLLRIFDLLLLIAPTICLADNKTISVGDINQDGKQETVVEVLYGGSMSFADVKILSNGKTLLILSGLCKDSADNYKIKEKQIAVWRADWGSEPSRRNPHYYNITWYKWSSKERRFVQVKEGFTSQKYSYIQAQNLMPKKVASLEGIIISKGISLAQDAGKLACTKYGRLYGKSVVKIEALTAAVYVDKWYEVSLAQKPGGQVRPVFVIFYRNGNKEITTATDY